MEEKSIKDFDRTIEQAMNEYSVAPPFGMWNRISAELGTTEGVVVTPKPILPKGMVAGFVAGALLIGSAITGLLVYNGTTNLHNVTNTPLQQQTNSNPSSINANTVALPAVIDNNTSENNSDIIAEEPVVPKVKTMVITALHTTKSANMVKQINVPVANINTNPMGLNNAINNNNDVAVPQMAVGAKAISTDTYYFPPVDINVPGENIGKQSTAANDDANNDEDVKNSDAKKITRSSSSSSPERIKFKKRRRTHYTYPTIVRRKK